MRRNITIDGTCYEYLVRTVLSHNSDECLIWPFNKVFGYGVVFIPGEGHVAKRVHRVAYRLAHGHYPEHDGCHTCDNPSCYNPRHIFDGTDKDNFRDMIAKGRSLRGERNRAAILTEANVRSARMEFAAGASRSELAKKYGVSTHTIKKAVYGYTWKHLT
jgi:hypothetical protein